MAKPIGGSWTSKFYRTKASTAYAKGDMLMSDGTDIIPATSAAATVLGIADQAKAVGDATNGRIKVLVPRGPAATMQVAMTGTFTAAYEGRAYDVSDSTTVTTGATTYKCIQIDKFLSSTSAIVSIRPPIA